MIADFGFWIFQTPNTQGVMKDQSHTLNINTLPTLTPADYAAAMGFKGSKI